MDIPVHSFCPSKEKDRQDKRVLSSFPCTEGCVLAVTSAKVKDVSVALALAASSSELDNYFAEVSLGPHCQAKHASKNRTQQIL